MHLQATKLEDACHRKWKELQMEEAMGAATSESASTRLAKSMDSAMDAFDFAVSDTIAAGEDKVVSTILGSDTDRAAEAKAEAEELGKARRVRHRARWCISLFCLMLFHPSTAVQLVSDTKAAKEVITGTAAAFRATQWAELTMDESDNHYLQTRLARVRRKQEGKKAVAADTVASPSWRPLLSEINVRPPPPPPLSPSLAFYQSTVSVQPFG